MRVVRACIAKFASCLGEHEVLCLRGQSVVVSGVGQRVLRSIVGAISRPLFHIRG